MKFFLEVLISAFRFGTSFKTDVQRCYVACCKILI